MSEFYWFTLTCLISARITRFLVIDEGPFGIFTNIRSILGAEGESFRDGYFSKLFNCPWCMATNVTPLVAACIGSSTLFHWLCHSLAASFVAGALVVWTHRP
jgi:hypothetical protein